jgi:hypothetical protein
MTPGRIRGDCFNVPNVINYMLAVLNKGVAKGVWRPSLLQYVYLQDMKRFLILFTLSAFTAFCFEGCFLTKNRCDTCPGVAKHKTVRKRNKGSI